MQHWLNYFTSYRLCLLFSGLANTAIQLIRHHVPAKAIEQPSANLSAAR
jgi:hypothetical protein